MSYESVNQGLKRKRDEGTQVDIRVKLSGKLHHGLREAKQAAKKAKGFETQKLVKRLKGNKSAVEVMDTSSLERQLKELKDADTERFGTLALFNKLKKDKFLSRNPDFQAAFKDEQAKAPAQLSSGLSPQLEARFLSSKSLSAEINAIVLSIRNILSPSLASQDEPANEETAEHPNKVAKLTSTVASRAVGHISPDELLSSEDELSSKDDGSDKTQDVDQELTGPDDGWESGTVHSEDENSDELKEDSAEDLEVELASASTLTSTAAKKSKPSESLFLPSLAVGFTRGDSDSDFSDSEAKAVDSIRKNRRGQRARRAIWEKKYGKGAKHLSKDGEDQRESHKPHQRDNRRRPQHDRSSQTHPARPVRHETPPHSQSARESVSNFNNPRSFQKPPNTATEKPLHPSWEAKKRLKEQQSAGIQVSQGTRISFND